MLTTPSERPAMKEVIGFSRPEISERKCPSALVFAVFVEHYFDLFRLKTIFTLILNITQLEEVIFLCVFQMFPGP